jgi:hypothetical protein
MQNRVQETTTTGGTGTITLAGAVTGYITFAAGFTTGDVLFYTIDNGIGEWEIGIGTLVTTGTLSRTTVIASSNSGALVNFSSGTKRVFCSAPTRSLVPDQDSKSGYVLTTDGTNPSWTQTLNSVNIGNTTAGTGAFTTLSASSTVSGTGFSNYLASPPAIGGSSPAAGNFTNLSYTGTLTGGTGVIAIGTNQIYKDASGNVGIGTSSPAATLDIRASSSGVRIGNYNFAGINIFGSSVNTSGVYLGLDSGGGFVTNVRDAGYLAYSTNNTERLRISSTGVVTIGSAISLDPTTANSLVVNSSGNVGIGTASPGMKLDIAGISGWQGGTTGQVAQITGQSSGANGGGNLRVNSNNSQAADAGGSITLGGYYIGTANSIDFAQIIGAKENATSGNAAGYLAFATRANGGNTTERARITSAGELLIGTTTDNGAYLLQVNSQIWATNATIATSDARLKENVTPIENALSAISKMEPVAFDFIQGTDYNLDSARQTGFIAQDLQAAIANEEYADCVVKECGPYLGVAYEKLIPVLVKSIQELHAEIESLKQRIN